MKKKKETKFNKKQYTQSTINNYDSDGYTAIGRACKHNDLRTVKKILKAFPETDLAKGQLKKQQFENTLIQCKDMDKYIKNGMVEMTAIEVAQANNADLVLKKLFTHDSSKAEPALKSTSSIMFTPDDGENIAIQAYHAYLNEVFSENYTMGRISSDVQVFENKQGRFYEICTQTTKEVANQQFNNLMSQIYAQDRAAATSQNACYKTIKSAIKNDKKAQVLELAQALSLHNCDRTGIKANTNELIRSIKENNIECVKIITNSTPELVDQKEETLWQTPLHFAARLGQNEILEFLIENSKELNPLDIKGFTPLDYALKEGQIFTVLLLMKHGITYSKFENNYNQALAGGNMKKLHKVEKYMLILQQAKEMIIKESEDAVNDVTIIGGEYNIELAGSDALDNDTVTNLDE
ncbi:MAG: ankyrin repeat domain-containing protein [Rickettsiaceae bacterium]